MTLNKTWRGGIDLVMNVTTIENSRREQLLSMISDDYKSLYGFRPRGDYARMSDDELQEWHNEIQETLHWEMETAQRDEREHTRRVNEAMTHKPWTLGDFLPCMN